MDNNARYIQDRLNKMNELVNEVYYNNTDRGARAESEEESKVRFSYEGTLQRIEAIIDLFERNHIETNEHYKQNDIYSYFDLNDLLDVVKKVEISLAAFIQEGHKSSLEVLEFYRDQIKQYLKEEVIALEVFIQETKALLKARKEKQADDLYVAQIAEEKKKECLRLQEAVQSRIYEYASTIKEKQKPLENDEILAAIQKSFTLLTRRIASMIKPSRFIVSKITTGLRSIENLLVEKIDQLKSSKNNYQSCNNDLNDLNNLINNLKQYADNSDEQQLHADWEIPDNGIPSAPTKSANPRIVIIGRQPDNNTVPISEDDREFEEVVTEFEKNVNEYVETAKTEIEAFNTYLQNPENNKSPTPEKIFQLSDAVLSSYRAIPGKFIQAKNESAEKIATLYTKHQAVTLEYHQALCQVNEAKKKNRELISKIKEPAAPFPVELGAIEEVINSYEQCQKELEGNDFQNKLNSLKNSMNETDQVFGFSPLFPKMVRGKAPIHQRLQAKKARLDEVNENLETIIGDEGILSTVDQTLDKIISMNQPDLSTLSMTAGEPGNNNKAEELKNRVNNLKTGLGVVADQVKTMAEKVETLTDRLDSLNQAIAAPIKIVHRFENDVHSTGYIAGEAVLSTETVSAGVRVENDLEYTKSITEDGAGSTVSVVTDEDIDDETVLHLTVNAMLDAINSNVIDDDNHFYIAGSDLEMLTISILIAKASRIPLNQIDAVTFGEDEEETTPFSGLKAIYEEASQSDSPYRKQYQQIQAILEAHKETYLICSRNIAEEEKNETPVLEEIHTNAYALRGIYSQLADEHKRVDGYVYHSAVIDSIEVAGGSGESVDASTAVESPREHTKEAELEPSLLCEKPPAVTGANIAVQKQTFFGARDVELFKQAIIKKAEHAEQKLILFENEKNMSILVS